jgi:hypothetical protein
MGLMQLSVGVSVTDLVILVTVTLIEMPLHPSVDPICEISGSHVQSMILSLLTVAVPVLP